MEATQKNPPLLVRLDDAAAMLGTSRSTIKRLIGGGRLVAVNISERSPRVTVESIEALIVKSKVPEAAS